MELRQLHSVVGHRPQEHLAHSRCLKFGQFFDALVGRSDEHSLTHELHWTTHNRTQEPTEYFLGTLLVIGQVEEHRSKGMGKVPRLLPGLLKNHVQPSQSICE